jgi:SAM-dependent methyltransferase
MGEVKETVGVTPVSTSGGEASPTNTSLHPSLEKQTAFAMAEGVNRLRPTLRNPDYLVLTERRRLLATWIETLPKEPLQVLDIGGRIQPYRPLLEGRLGSYTAVDPLATKLVNAVAVGERLPFAAACFDLAICTQVLCYCENPFQVVQEIHRVLKPGGALLLSSPAIFPRHAEQDRWRFFPSGLQQLLHEFSHVEIAPEGYSVGAICRTVTVGLDQYFTSGLPHRLANSLLIPLINRLGRRFDPLSRRDTRFTTNYSAFAKK